MRAALAHGLCGLLWLLLWRGGSCTLCHAARVRVVLHLAMFDASETARTATRARSLAALADSGGPADAGVSLQLEAGLVLLRGMRARSALA